MPQSGISSSEVRLVYCLSIDLIESTLPGLRMTQVELDRFNRALVAQIEPHLDALGFEDLLVKFTGDGWLLMTPELRDAERLCALSAIMRGTFVRDMRQRTGLPEARIPDLRMAICTGRDIRVTVWQGSFDWVGDSARRASRSASYCYPNEVLVDGSVHSLVMRDFVTVRIDPNVRPLRSKRRQSEEDIPLWSLEDLRLEAVEDWDAAAAYVYALGQLGRTDEAAEASMRAASRLGDDEAIPDEAAAGRNISRWNRLIATAPTYDAVLELLARLLESPTRLNVDTLNALVDRSPTFDEAMRWVADLELHGVRPEAVTFNALIRRSPDYQTALTLLADMDEASVDPTGVTLHALVMRAPTFRAALGLLTTLGDRGVVPDAGVFDRLIARAPGYDAAVGVLDVMRHWNVAPGTTAMNRLIARAPEYEAACEWLEVMDSRGIPTDVTTYNTLIARAGRYGAALGWLEVMRRHGVEADVTTFNTLMSRAPDHEFAVGLLRRMEDDGVSPNSETFKALIARAPDYATSVGWLAEMRRRGIRPNNEVFKALIAQSPDFETAAAWLSEMPSHNVAPNTETFRTLMGRAPDYPTAQTLLDEMTTRGIQPNGETFRTLASLVPDRATATALVNLMPALGVRPDADIFLPLIAREPDLAAARGWIERMETLGVVPNSETLTALLRRAASHEEAAGLLDELGRQVEPNEGAFKVLVELAPDFVTARGWIDRMRTEGMRPEVGVLTALLSKEPGDLTGDELLTWYLSLDHHPSGPMRAAMDAYCRQDRVRDALRLALDYPHLDAARTVFRDHREAALEYLDEVLGADPGHPNGRYAMGLALLEVGRTEEALTHLELARELARPGPRVAALEEIIRTVRATRS